MGLKMIGIIDYNAGNVKSVEMALESMAIPYIPGKKPEELKNADKLIFPGVGDAAYAMKQLKVSGFDVFLKDHAQKNTPIMGICLGSQIIFDYSEEGDTDCLGLVPGKITHFKKIFDNEGIPAEKLKIPHMGWNEVHCKEDLIFKNIKEGTDFYFVHSYVIEPAFWSDVRAFCEYGIKVPAVIRHGSVIACQFHPEKSGEAGLRLLKNFCNSDYISVGVSSC